MEGAGLTINSLVSTAFNCVFYNKDAWQYGLLTYHNETDVFTIHSQVPYTDMPVLTRAIWFLEESLTKISVAEIIQHLSTEILKKMQVCVLARVVEELAIGHWAFAVHSIFLREKQVEEKNINRFTLEFANTQAIDPTAHPCGNPFLPGVPKLQHLLIPRHIFTIGCELEEAEEASLYLDMVLLMNLCQ
ncbi:hypothetical protein DUI87_22205 [Hirundo rustica rustica]|uniref:Uncharacterized protein n=1 Tax=Hirundo rustica rustica TaxID=333673 RepID=A0A3M0JJT2_HIRRU|nr:hypothetical protein DUI87_22205 [Hirundo rustica rustica]